jgi:outer membrane protein insertion porin family
MGRNRYYFKFTILLAIVAFCTVVFSCNSVRRVKDGEYLLRKNTLKIKSDKTITHKGELSDQLALIVAQKPNTYWSGIFPLKLWRYNLRYKKYVEDPTLDLPKSLEKPVIYDSILQKRSIVNIRNFLANQGYFNSKISDTVIFKNKKAYVTYRINTGINYRIDNVHLDIDDSLISSIVKRGMSNTIFKREAEYSKALADEERTRIVTQLHNNGFYKFTLDNVTFQLDTVNKSEFRNADNLVESAINFITLQKQQRKYAIDIKIIIRANGESDAYQQYHIGKITVFPDFEDNVDFRDTSMIQKMIDSVRYKYHNYYVRENVLQKQIFIRPGDLYSQADHDLTINKLNDLGIFQYVRLNFREDTDRNDKILNCAIYLSPAKKLDAGLNYEVANATTYILGTSIGLNFRDKNFFKGANLLSISLSGGVEFGYNELQGQTFQEHLFLQSTNIGVNASLIFPKFLLPFKQTKFSNKNLPRTQLGLGVNVLDRLNYFKLSNVTANFSYNWKQSISNTWDLSPAFASVVLPSHISDSFQHKLDSNDFLRNSYRRTFIEGENISFTFSDQIKKQGRNYNYLRLSFEEAGLVMAGINEISKSISKSKDFIFDQYLKIDLDARKYINAKHSSLAFRFLAGIGNPYGGSSTLPYVKQYFVGGPYSIRGWRPRTLGPVSVSDSNNTLIDRTGDMKLEMNAEFRFDMIQLFSGTINLNGALFADAGNTWLARKSVNYPNGELDISRFGNDIAVSTGAGLRIIIASFFTVRLDAAFPIKNPYISANSGWVLKEVDLGNSSWRAQNLVLNVAIGMPF